VRSSKASCSCVGIRTQGTKESRTRSRPSQLEMKLFPARGRRRRKYGLLRKAPNQGSPRTTLRCCLLYGRRSQYASGLRYNDPASEMAWVRTDGRRIADDPALLQQGKADIALCHADMLGRQMKRRALAWLSAAMLSFRRIRQRKCVQHMLPPPKGDQIGQMMQRGR